MQVCLYGIQTGQGHMIKVKVEGTKSVHCDPVTPMA